MIYGTRGVEEREENERAEKRYRESRKEEGWKSKVGETETSKDMKDW